MRISHSALTTYLECSFKYYLHYFMKLRPTAQKSSLAFGDAIDSGLNHLLETRNLEEATFMFLQSWTQWKNKNVEYTKSDAEPALTDDGPWENLRERGIIILQEFNNQIMPRIREVLAVQVNRFIPNDIGDELIIKTDFIAVWDDGRIVLFDNKTSSVKYEDDAVRTSPQLGIYFEQLQAEYNLDAAGYIVIPKRVNKRKEPRVDIKVIIDSVSPETIENTLAQYDEVLAALKEARFEKNMNSCISKYGKCPYYDYCRSGNKQGLKEMNWEKK